MGLYNAAKSFREKANMYLEMIRYVREDRHRLILHKLFEENEMKADAFEIRASRLSWISQPDGRAPDCH